MLPLQAAVSHSETPFNSIAVWLINASVNCGGDAAGFIHGGVNVGLECDGLTVKQCIDQEMGISGNTDYECVCNTCG